VVLHADLPSATGERHQVRRGGFATQDAASAENCRSEATGAFLCTLTGPPRLFLAADASVEPDLRWVALDITLLSPEWQLDDPGLHHVEPVEEPLDVLS
jgi:hypothetical protein